jgi:hypothetical protein
MKYRRRTSFSSGPSRYLVCCDRRPLATELTFESAAKAAKALSALHPGASFTIYDIWTGIHVEAETPKSSQSAG